MLLAHSLFNEGHSFFKCIFKTSKTKCGILHKFCVKQTGHTSYQSLGVQEGRESPQGNPLQDSVIWRLQK